MMEHFNFNAQDDSFNAIIDSIVESAQARYEAKSEPSKEDL